MDDQIPCKEIITPSGRYQLVRIANPKDCCKLLADLRRAWIRCNSMSKMSKNKSLIGKVFFDELSRIFDIRNVKIKDNKSKKNEGFEFRVDEIDTHK